MSIDVSAGSWALLHAQLPIELYLSATIWRKWCFDLSVMEARAMVLKSLVRIKPKIIKPEHRYAAAAARGAFALDAAAAARRAFALDRAACPRCGTGSLQPTGDNELRRCDGCGSSVSLDELASRHGEWLNDTAEQRHDHFKRSFWLLAKIAGIALMFAAGASIYAGSSQMIFAAFVLAIPMFAAAFAMRYRAWQAATGRFYEAKAPLGDFMRDELRSLTGGRG
ncbi:hypothetical protein [Agrobacterium tumefaciens]|uniref:hypothetical protein n=1 Tax=Agrobacterium tumefaciens TaxID=358 RepID=UPI00220AEC4F|nr:hypothetical protein FY131_29250 [Agrobacterium tumefaciens]